MLQSAPKDLKPNPRNRASKVPYNYTVPRVPNFRPFCSTISPFLDIPHFRFDIDSYVKISKCHKIFHFLAGHQNIHSFIFPSDCHIYHKVWARLDENCRSSVLKFPAPYGSVLTKISKCHKIFKFWQITKNSYSLNSLMTNILTIKFGWNWVKTGGPVAF